MKEVVENFSELVDSINGPKKQQLETIFDTRDWSLYANERLLDPLIFSNKQTQADVVEQAVKAVKSGSKVIFIHGVCGTGKSAIALNIARRLGRASIVVPVKALQQQYEEDYMGKKYVLKSNGKKMRISMITGRENHPSLIKDNANCADPTLPDTIKINERNYQMLKEYYMQNPFIENKVTPELKDIKRVSIAPANPYWSPIVPAQIDLQLKDAKKKRYKGLGDKEFIFYHRKEGCSYYDQYQAYVDADVIIFNAAKYKIETALNRKPATDVEIIDEADEFLDNFSTQQSLNLSRLAHTLSSMTNPDPESTEAIKEMQELLRLEERNKIALGVNEYQIVKISETKLEKLLNILLDHPEIEDAVSMDEFNYISHACEVARMFEPFFEETYLTFRKDEKDLIASLVSTNLSKQFAEIVSKNKTLILMSGTLHSPEVLKNVYGIPEFTLINAETKLPGTIEIMRTGKEFDCRYSNFDAKRHTRQDYLQSLDLCIARAPRPTLVHVNAFEDLPSEEERVTLNLKHTMTREQLKDLQYNDSNNRLVGLFKKGMTDILFSTKCSRGVDFPGKMCNSIVFTKYPNPNPNDTFWKILQKTHANYFWDLYKDKARREFLQRLYRALRSPTDHVFVLSPDTRILDATRELQRG